MVGREVSEEGCGVCEGVVLDASTGGGGKAADGIDCSGVVFMVYLMNGVLIWRDADIREGYPMKAIWREGEEMCLVEERAKGRGICCSGGGNVGMYLGDGRYLHCTGHERVFGCRVNSLRRGDEDFRKDLAEALKVVGSVFFVKCKIKCDCVW